METSQQSSFKTAKYSKYLLKSIELLEALHEENRTGNAKTNLTQNANSPPISSDEESDKEDLGEDLDEYTDKILQEMKHNRERTTSNDTKIKNKLQEVEHVYRKPQAAYDLSELENVSSENMKTVCASSRQRLKKLEVQVSRLGRKKVFDDHDKKEKTTQADSLKLSSLDELTEDYDWSLPDLELPEFQNMGLTPANTKSSDHNASAVSAVQCSVEGSHHPQHPVILKSDVELMGWKAQKLGDDYKFTRLSNDEDLRLFIEEHTIDEQDVPLDKVKPEIVYNENTGKFHIVSPRTQEEGKPERNKKNRRNSRKSRISKESEKDKVKDK